jgi:hypothetical protein
MPPASSRKQPIDALLTGSSAVDTMPPTTLTSATVGPYGDDPLRLGDA